MILKAQELDGYLTAADKDDLLYLDELYKEALAVFPKLETEESGCREKLISLYEKMGNSMKEICLKTPAINVYSFLTSRENHFGVSGVIAKLRDVRTENQEFIYYIQRAFEMLFKLAWGRIGSSEKNYLFVKTHITNPVQNYAVHKIANIDEKINNTVMCVMLRGALLPSMIMSKEIQEYSSTNYATPFALFRIKRNEHKKENDMEYILDLEKSYFSLDTLDGKDLVFADPMNATGGSLVTVVKYLLGKGIKPRSVQIFNVISALKGALRTARALENCSVYTLWMDPVLNDDAYIMPGLGDAGDRINGQDSENDPRGIIRLIANYGSIVNLYRAQVREIEKSCFAGKK